MFRNVKIRNKIIIAIASILMVTLLSVILIISIKSGYWFCEEAEAKLNTAAKVVLADIGNRVEKMARDITILTEDYEIISPTSAIRDLIKDNPDHIFDASQIEMSKNVALYFRKISDTRKGFHLIRLYDAGATLIAFYEKSHRTAGWYQGGGKFSGMKGNNKLLEDVPLPSYVGLRYSGVLPEKADTGFNVFADHLEISAYSPVYKRLTGNLFL